MPSTPTNAPSSPGGPGATVEVSRRSALGGSGSIDATPGEDGSISSTEIVKSDRNCVYRCGKVGPCKSLEEVLR